MVFGGAAAAVIVVGLVGVWLFWTNVVRGPLGAAEVVPASADIVLTVDALEFIEGDRFSRLINAFDPEGEATFSVGDLLSDIDDEIETELGFRVLGDATEWMGRSAAIGVWAPDDFFETFGAEPDVVISVMTRNDDRAREIIDALSAAAARDGADVDKVIVAGVEVDSVKDGSDLFLATVHENRVLFANDEGRMAEMIDPTNPVTEVSAYQRLWNAAGGDDAFASVYVSEDFFDSLVTTAFEASGTNSSGVPSGALIATATLDDDGVEFAGASIALDDAGVEVAGSWGRELPSGVYGYFSAALPFERADVESLFDEQVDQLTDLGLGVDIDSFLASFEDQLGVSLRELLAQFTDEVLFAAVQSDFGPLPALAGGPLGIGFAIGVEDDAVIADALARLPDLLGPDAQFIEQLGDTIWAVDTGEGEVARFGVVDGRLVIAGDEHAFNAMLGAGGGVTDGDEWKRLAGLIGDDMFVFVDIARIVDTFAPSDEADELAVLRSFGASSSVEDGIAVIKARLVLDY
jgi:hypothetical protein